jgi:uncharacterized protein YjbI with pentapeptide repeats
VLKLQSLHLTMAVLTVLFVGFFLFSTALAQKATCCGIEREEKGPCCGEVRTVDTTLIRFGAPWYCADLRGVNLRGVMMMDAFLSWSDVSYALMEGANFYYGDFTGANFTGANLNGTNLTHTRLVLTDFTDANLEGAILTHAILMRTNFTGATYNKATRWPLGFDPVGSGAIRVD